MPETAQSMVAVSARAYCQTVCDAVATSTAGQPGGSPQLQREARHDGHCRGAILGDRDDACRRVVGVGPDFGLQLCAQAGLLRRIQIVRSLVSRRIITSNLREMQDRSRFTGKVTIKQSDPLSGNELVVSENELRFCSTEEGFVAVVDFEQQQATGQERVHELQASLSHFQFEVEFLNRCRSQRGLLYYRPLRKARKSDLYYCFMSISNSLVLKLYFSPSDRKSRADASLVLSSIQAVSSERILSTCRMRNPSFSETVGRANKASVHESNYRFNVLASEAALGKKRLLQGQDFQGGDRKKESGSDSSGHKSLKSFQSRKKPGVQGLPSMADSNKAQSRPQDFRSSSQALREAAQKELCRPVLRNFDSNFTRHRSPLASSEVERKSKTKSLENYSIKASWPTPGLNCKLGLDLRKTHKKPSVSGPICSPKSALSESEVGHKSSQLLSRLPAGLVRSANEKRLGLAARVLA